MARLVAGDGAARGSIQRHGRALLRFSVGDVPLAPGRRRHGARHLRRADARAGLTSIRRRARCSVICAACCAIASAITSASSGAGSRSTTARTAQRPRTRRPRRTGPVDEIARSEITAAFRRAMLELPLPHREVIALCDLEELPYATVATILDCPVGTVRSRLHRARALLTMRLASLEVDRAADRDAAGTARPHMTENLHPQVASLRRRRTRATWPAAFPVLTWMRESAIWSQRRARIFRRVIRPRRARASGSPRWAALGGRRRRWPHWPSPRGSSSACASSAPAAPPPASAQAARARRGRRRTSPCGRRIPWRSRFPAEYPRRHAGRRGSA